MGNKGCKRRQVIGTTAAGETLTLAESADSEWSMVNSPWFLQLPSSNDDDGHILQLTGPHTVSAFSFFYLLNLMIPNADTAN